MAMYIRHCHTAKGGCQIAALIKAFLESMQPVILTCRYGKRTERSYTASKLEEHWRVALNLFEYHR